MDLHTIPGQTHHTYLFDDSETTYRAHGSDLPPQPDGCAAKGLQAGAAQRQEFSLDLGYALHPAGPGAQR